MNDFIARYQDQVSGVITGFDCLVFRGNLPLNHDVEMQGFLWVKGVAWKDYAQYVTEISQRVKQASLASLEELKRPIRYLPSGKQSKKKWPVTSRWKIASEADRYAHSQRWNPAPAGE